MNAFLNWETVRDFYKEKFGIESWVVEMYANMDILSLCVSGASNKTIEKFLEIPIEDIKATLDDTFSFSGWEQDLPVNPYKVFEENSQHPLDVSIVLFDNEISNSLEPYENFRNVDTVLLYYMCKTVEEIERKIKDEWI